MSPKLRIKIDRRVVFNGTVGEWISKPPDIFKDRIQPGARPEPHMKAIMVALADAVMTNQPMSIAVKTRDDGWSMEVTNG